MCDMTWVHKLRGGVKRVHDVRETGYQPEQAAGTGKHLNRARLARQDFMGAQGDYDRMLHNWEVNLSGGALRAVIWR